MLLNQETHLYSKKGEKDRVDVGSCPSPPSTFMEDGLTHAATKQFIVILPNYSGFCVCGSFQLCKLRSEFALFVVKNLNSHFLCV